MTKLEILRLCCKEAINQSKLIANLIQAIAYPSGTMARFSRHKIGTWVETEGIGINRPILYDLTYSFTNIVR